MEGALWRYGTQEEGSTSHSVIHVLPLGSA
jgi:hypothetical protein